MTKVMAAISNENGSFKVKDVLVDASRDDSIRFVAQYFDHAIMLAESLESEEVMYNLMDTIVSEVPQDRFDEIYMSLAAQFAEKAGILIEEPGISAVH